MPESSDPFRKVRPNEPVNFSATAWNAMLAAAQAEQNRQFDKQTDARGHFRQSGIIRVRNDSGTDLTRNSVLGLDAPIFLPGDGGSNDAFLREVTFGGSIPAEEHRGRFCVLLEPALDGRIAQAWVAGTCQVMVDVTDESHTTAEIEEGETASLISSASGSAQIVWRQGLGGYYGYDTGLQWAIIRFSAVAQGGGSGRIAKTGGAGIGGRTGVNPVSGTVTEWTFNGTELESSPVFTAWNLATESVGPNAFIITIPISGYEFIIWEECVEGEAEAESSPPPSVTNPDPGGPPGGPAGDEGFSAYGALQFSDVPGTYS